MAVYDGDGLRILRDGVDRGVKRAVAGQGARVVPGGQERFQLILDRLERAELSRRDVLGSSAHEQHLQSGPGREQVLDECRVELADAGAAPAPDLQHARPL